MKSLQDKICDALTLVGLLGVIGFGSASLLPESEDKPKEEAPTIDSTDVSAMPTDTIEEIHAAPQVVEKTEEFSDSLLTDSTDVLMEEPVDTASSVTESHSAKEENASQHDKHQTEEHHQDKEAKQDGAKEVHHDNLME